LEKLITIIDYGVGNLGSIQNMIKKVGGMSQITSDISAINDASKILLPGVGAFDNGMQKLNERNLIEVLNKKVKVDRVPILGICLGAQLMTKGSEEGELPGFNWVDIDTVKFKIDTEQTKVPHMGWNEVVSQKESKLFDSMFDNPRFYFVHSYHFKSNNKALVLTTTDYGYEFASSFEHENILGAQFHPEKSHKFGMKLMKNFVEKY
jgi:imidazole glycerol-phosphate synthase subunit HisH